jgi:hypothetical protein
MNTDTYRLYLISYEDGVRVITSATSWAHAILVGQAINPSMLMASVTICPAKALLPGAVV